MENETGDGAAAPRPLKIFIGVPYYRSVEPGFAWSLANAVNFFNSLAYQGTKDILIEFCGGTILPEQRSILVSRAMDQGASHLLFLDADMKFPADTINRLLNHGKAVVAINYPRKNMEARPTAYVDDGEYTGPLYTTEKSTGLQPVQVAGFGAMLIDMRVFDEIEIPFFVFLPVGKDQVKTAGEDVYFCKKIAQAGVEIFIDQDLSKQVSHIGTFEFTNQLSCQAEQTKQQLYKALP